MPRMLGSLLLVVTVAAGAQTAAPAPAPKPLVAELAGHPGQPAAKNPADVDTVDHLLSALYDVISGPAAKQRDWERFRSLFLPDGRLGVIRPDTPAADGKPALPSDVILITPEIYIERDDPYFQKNGFFECAVANRIETFGNLISVWSTYESRHALADPKPFARGINSIQIAHAAGRYWIVSILWDDERPGLTLPERYLGGDTH
jgi:hypothetical protein